MTHFFKIQIYLLLKTLIFKTIDKFKTDIRVKSKYFNKFDFINKFPSTSYEKDDLLTELSNMSQGTGL